MIISAGTYLGTALTFPVVFAFWLYMNKMQIIPEERALSDLFGEEFIDYRGKVRRWI